MTLPWTRRGCLKQDRKYTIHEEKTDKVDSIFKFFYNQEHHKKVQIINKFWLQLIVTDNKRDGGKWGKGLLKCIKIDVYKGTQHIIVAYSYF